MLDLIEHFEHIRRDGVKTHLLRWKSHCIDCGAEFEQVTGMIKPPELRRCDQRRGGPTRHPSHYPSALVEEVMAELRGGALL
ncbi:MAG TPA: hypothetical protein VGE96_00880 [Steroidobacteraceae bacterium]